MANILVVDDELGIRDLLSEILNDEGHQVELAENAAQARAARLRAKAKELCRGVERQKLSRIARQVETAMQIDEWLGPPGLRAPR